MTTEKAFANAWINVWRDEIRWITLGEAIVVLKRLGGFEYDEILVLGAGYRRRSISQLALECSETEYCVNIWPVYFLGGPSGGKRFKGTLLTMVLDRVLSTVYEKGTDHTLRVVKYARHIGTENNEADFARDSVRSV